MSKINNIFKNTQQKNGHLDLIKYEKKKKKKYQ